ncbi:MAG: SH3 domain-containing protein [Lachnospiraceae bacterium]|nr:SH3 domain-containing protein [Lachnospiraceae bacterium]
MKRKLEKRMIAGFLAALLVVSGISLNTAYEVYAATVTVGTVNVSAGTLNIRSGPGTNYGKLGELVKGDQVTILGEVNGWYQISHSSGSAYVSKRYITNVHMVEQDVSYIDELTGMGFPISYADSLVTLHSQYPNWTFKPISTGLDWNTVLDKESAVGVNLVPSGNDDAQKSTASGAYDWTTNRWTGYDGASWVCASREMVAYCMDPRNFLNASSIFQFATNEYEESQTRAGVSAMLEGSFMAGAYTDADGAERNYPDDFVAIGSTLNVNPYHLAARCLQEQGKSGTSDSISGTAVGYEGYYNYFNIHAYPANGLTSVQNGLLYAKEQGWTTRYQSVYGGAATLSDGYVAKGQNTIYFEKFNVVNTTSGLYNHQYMTNVLAAINEGANMKKAYTDNDAAVTFWIPVYENMPASACVMPSGGNPNNWLSSLSVEGYTITPAFNGAVLDYSIVVAEGVSSLRVAGTPVASTSSVAGGGEIPIVSGQSEIRLVCTAQNQTSRTYTLHVTKGNLPDAQQPSTVPEQNHSSGEDAKTGAWIKQSGKWYFCYDDGTYATGWLNDGGTWYYLLSDGSMQTGWLSAGGQWYYLAASGAMQTGWVKSNSKWYYMMPDGAMGIGWQSINGKWYYFDTTGDGRMLYGWQFIHNQWYYLSSSSADGAMKIGWIKVGGRWYYMGSAEDGAMKTGWQYIDGKWYYLYDSGAMAYSTWIGNYYVNSSGAWSRSR